MFDTCFDIPRHESNSPPKFLTVSAGTSLLPRISYQYHHACTHTSHTDMPQYQPEIEVFIHLLTQNAPVFADTDSVNQTGLVQKRQDVLNQVNRKYPHKILRNNIRKVTYGQIQK